jgi:phosphoserine phosphatase RsbU/P
VRPGLALGYLPSYAYVEQAADLVPGEMIYLYTDGITEATNPRDEMFTEERLAELLRAQAERPAGTVAAATVAAVEEFAAGAPQFDDLTVLCIRYYGGAA